MGSMPHPMPIAEFIMNYMPVPAGSLKDYHMRILQWLLENPDKSIEQMIDNRLLHIPRGIRTALPQTL